MKNKLAAWIVLAVIAIVAAVALAATNEVTKDVIKAANETATQEAWAELVPGAEFPEAAEAAGQEEGEEAEETGDYVYAGVRDGETVGYVGATTVQGYGGEIEVIVGTDTEGTITGINVGGANFKETAGLGAKSKEPAFTDQFMGKTVPLTVGENIDAITASTITSNAVVRGVNTVVENIAKVAGFTIETPAAEAGQIGEGRYAATTKGFAGPVYVEIQLDDTNTITEIVIGDDSFAETAGYGQKALEPAFYEQFIGKTGQLALGTDIDAISGATITSTAVVDAVNTAMLYATDPEAAAALAAGDDFELPDVPEGALTETASRKGFGGPVAATITIDPDTHELLRVEFGDENWAETDGLGSRVHDEDFWHQFIGKKLPIAEGDIDLISGATITSQAAFEAVNKAYDKLFPSEDGGEEEAPFVLPDVPEGALTETASRKGFGGPVAATITIDPETHELLRVEFGDENWAETDGLGSRVHDEDFWHQFIGKKLPIAEGDIDLISGATITSQAAFEAVNKAYDKLFPSEEGAADQPAPASSDVDGNTASASSKGYGGPVSVTITIDDSNALTELTVGDENFAETTGLGSKVQEAEFIDQFIGKTLPLSEDDIDMVTGATISSEAVVSAVNKAYDKITAAGSEAPAPEATEAPAETGDANTASASSKGYGGPVSVTITIDDNNALTELTVGDENFAETTGLGSKVQEAEFIDQFIGKTLPLSEDDIDLISGATISSEAVVSAVNKAYDKITAAGSEAPAETGDANTASASSKGYGGPVSVTITIDDNNALTELTVGDENFAETTGLGSKVQDAEFIDQFIGKTLPLSEDDIDMVTGATISSEAVISAVNKAFDKITGAGSEAPAPEATEAPAETGDANTASASSKGYGGPVSVTITIDDNNALTELTVGDENFAETTGLGSKVQEAEFIDQFIGKTLPLSEDDIDLISGATISSEAVVSAVNKAYDKITAAGSEAPAPEATEAPAETGDANTASASSKGYGGPVSVTITIDDNNALTELTVGDENFAETTGLGSKVQEAEFIDQFIGKTLPLSEDDIDMVTGATISSEAVVNAINKAFDKLQAQ